MCSANCETAIAYLHGCRPCPRRNACRYFKRNLTTTHVFGGVICQVLASLVVPRDDAGKKPIVRLACQAFRRRKFASSIRNLVVTGLGLRLRLVLSTVPPITYSRLFLSPLNKLPSRPDATRAVTTTNTTYWQTSYPRAPFVCPPCCHPPHGP